MKNSLETRLGIFVALTVIAAVLILEVVGGPGRFERGYQLKALFGTVQDLKKGDRVKMAGVEIGRVEDITLDEANNKVLVTMKLRKNVQVRTDSVATVKFTGLMGQNFVSLDFGSRTAPLATAGTMLTTAEQPDLSAMMAKIDNVATGVENLTKSFTGDKIDNLLGPFTDFLKANREPLTASILNLKSVSSQIASGKGTVGKLIYDDSLYNSALTTVSNLQDTGNEIKATVADARKIIAQVNAGEGTVGKLLHDDTLYNETTASMTNLKEIMQKINQGQGSVGKIINDQELYRNAKLTLQKLDKATEGLEDQGPLSVMGIVVNKLF
ncbi:MAG TPA: MlaD family protein [Candidatus Acidoferrum sp.]|jgi:phospholipid/cholesterol/gamma-HCH transport system substrate-binding protein|nr:MlaD family protein [Candidatus Acidoferrum sp.]